MCSIISPNILQSRALGWAMSALQDSHKDIKWVQCWIVFSVNLVVHLEALNFENDGAHLAIVRTWLFVFCNRSWAVLRMRNKLSSFHCACCQSSQASTSQRYQARVNKHTGNSQVCSLCATQCSRDYKNKQPPVDFFFLSGSGMYTGVDSSWDFDGFEIIMVSEYWDFSKY